MIISVSRRSDVPRFYTDWFLDRVRAGFVDVTNPFDARRVRRISLDPADVQAFVFWTRDARPLLPHLAELDDRGFRYYFMTTLTGYPHEIEPGRMEISESIDAMKSLADAVGPSRSIWRYDPVFLSNLTDEDYHLDNFASLAQSLSGYTERIVFSVYDEYKKSKGRVSALSRVGIIPRRMRDETGHLLPNIVSLLGELAQLAKSCALSPRACAEAENLSPYGIEVNACIDGNLIESLWNMKLSFERDKNQRPACRCVKSVDIGTYDTCPAGCVYCYATSSVQKAKKNYLAGLPLKRQKEAPLLIKNPSG